MNGTSRFIMLLRGQYADMCFETARKKATLLQLKAVTTKGASKGIPSVHSHVVS